MSVCPAKIPIDAEFRNCYGISRALNGNTLSGHLDEEFLRFSSTIHVDLSGSILVNSGCRNFFYLFISSTVMHLNIAIISLWNHLKGEDWTWNNLNILCWVIRSISGPMMEEQENRFLVMVIRGLLNL